jgi:hypothetical protein
MPYTLFSSIRHLHDAPLDKVDYFDVDLRPRGEDRWESLPIPIGLYERHMCHWNHLYNC